MLACLFTPKISTNEKTHFYSALYFSNSTIHTNFLTLVAQPTEWQIHLI